MTVLVETRPVADALAIARDASSVYIRALQAGFLVDAAIDAVSLRTTPHEAGALIEVGDRSPAFRETASVLEGLLIRKAVDQELIRVQWIEASDSQGTYAPEQASWSPGPFGPMFTHAPYAPATCSIRFASPLAPPQARVVFDAFDLLDAVLDGGLPSPGGCRHGSIAAPLSRRFERPDTFVATWEGVAAPESWPCLISRWLHTHRDALRPADVWFEE